MSAPLEQPSPKRGSSWFSRSSRSSTPTPSKDDPTTQLAHQLDAASLTEGVEGGGEGEAGGQVGDVAQELQGDVESEAGKFKALLGILKKSLNVKDLSSIRVSLPATMMEPIGNLEFWLATDRPDYFAAMGEEDDELDRFLGVLRWMFTKELKYAKHPIAKPFNSILGEHFHCVYDTPVLSLHPKKKHPVPTAHLDENPHPDVLINAGRGASNNSTAAAPLKSSPSLTAIHSHKSPSKLSLTSKDDPVQSSSASVASARSATSAASAASSARSVSPSENGTARLVVINEQTSHHPPVSHLYIEARVEGKDGQPRRTVRYRGVDQLAAKFTGINVRIVPGPHNKGMFIELPERAEEYHISHPTAAVAGLVRAAPYATITDSACITVSPLDKAEREKEVKEGKKKRLRAIVAYQEESWITRPRFLVEGVVYHSYPNEAAGASDATDEGDDKRFSKIKQVPADRVVGRLEGNWRGEIVYKPADKSPSFTLVDLLPLAVAPKAVAPLADQDPLETRKVWAPVCDALAKKDYSTASREKQRIEQEQRDKAEERKRTGEVYRPVYFEPEPDAVEDWDGRPTLTAAGKAALERDFKAQYDIEPVVAGAMVE